ncbi:MAG: Extracellular solute-binding protein family 1 [Parcubacteria group bacterium GW2011_GWC2_38_7]|nr:MAG: Extracellular solute-binding protein family 1 [Parcubacteria group bacterium GW2011_GWC2_38_7]
MVKRGGFKIALVSLMAFVLLFSSGCAKGGTTAAKDAYKPVELEYWSVWNDEADVRLLITAYQQVHPNVRINYKKLRYEEYEMALLEAMAEDRGPDVFSLHNTWTRKYQSRLLPAPVSVNLPYKFMTGTVKKEEVVELRPSVMISPAGVAKTFLDVVADDVVLMQNTATEGAKPNYEKKVYALPLSLDTLVLYYNKDLLNNTGIVAPPTNWTEFQEQTKKITKIDKDTGDIILSGAAIGTADNVVRSFDILSLLMMQNLAPMLDDTGSASFDKIPKAYPNITVPPGLGALDFYTQFSSPLYEGYCWNNKLPNSLEAFIKGKTAFFFGYAYNRAEIMSKAPKLNFNIAAVPQVSDAQKVNYANYWVEAVSNKTKVSSYAWDFVNFITQEANVEAYLDQAKKPTALRSTKLINKQLADGRVEVFADQLLTAKSWYKGLNPEAAEQSFKEMINVVLDGSLETQKAIKQAVAKVTQSIYTK